MKNLIILFSVFICMTATLSLVSATPPPEINLCPNEESLKYFNTDVRDIPLKQEYWLDAMIYGVCSIRPNETKVLNCLHTDSNGITQYDIITFKLNGLDDDSKIRILSPVLAMGTRVINSGYRCLVYTNNSCSKLLEYVKYGMVKSV